MPQGAMALEMFPTFLAVTWQGLPSCVFIAERQFPLFKMHLAFAL